MAPPTLASQDFWHSKMSPYPCSTISRFEKLERHIKRSQATPSLWKKAWKLLSTWKQQLKAETEKYKNRIQIQISSAQSLSCVQLFATPWITARQASLSITNSRSSLKLTSIELVMPSGHLILCHPLLLLPPIPPSNRVFPMSQLFTWGGQSIGVSASALVLPMNTGLQWTL